MSNFQNFNTSAFEKATFHLTNFKALLSVFYLSVKNYIRLKFEKITRTFRAILDQIRADTKNSIDFLNSKIKLNQTNYKYRCNRCQWKKWEKFHFGKIKRHYKKRHKGILIIMPRGMAKRMFEVNYL